jgi:hypothetical protein
MGKSRIKDRWLREKQKRENLEKGRQPNSKIEKPRKRTSGFIQKILSKVKPEWMAKDNGHRRNPQGNIKVSGMVRAKLKEETRKEVEDVRDYIL